MLSGCSDPVQKALQQGAQAQALFDAGQIQEAQKLALKAVQTRDDIIDLQLLRGRIETAARSPDGAFDAYNDALALDASNGEALLGVAHFGMETGHLEESEQAADRLLTLDPGQPDALLIKGIYNIVHNRADAALANAESMLSKMPGNESGLILKARALSMRGDIDQALHIMEDQRKNGPPSPSIARTLLELYRFKDDGPAMIREFELLRRSSPGDMDLMLDQANALYKLGKTTEARALVRGMMFRPDISATKASKAVDLWTEYDAAPLTPADVAALGARGSRIVRKAAARFYLDRNDPANALAVVGADGGDQDILGLKAQAAIARGDIAGGLGMADQIVRRDTTNCEAQLARGQALLAQRRYTDVIVAVQVATTSCPQLVPAHVVLARAQAALNNKASAEVAFQTATDRNSQNRPLARIYTSWLEQQGRSTKAVSLARRLTNAAPALVSGWQLYLDLCKRYPDAACAADATDGLAMAKARYAVDPRPDDPEKPGLFSRLKRDRDDDKFNAEAASRVGRPRTNATYDAP